MTHGYHPKSACSEVWHANEAAVWDANCQAVKPLLPGPCRPKVGGCLVCCLQSLPRPSPSAPQTSVGTLRAYVSAGDLASLHCAQRSLHLRPCLCILHGHLQRPIRSVPMHACARKPFQLVVIKSTPPELIITVLPLKNRIGWF